MVIPVSLFTAHDPCKKKTGHRVGGYGILHSRGGDMSQPTTHKEQLPFLRKIEGQIRGIQRMIEDERYCVDILNQIHSVLSALARVEDKVLEKHFENCVQSAVGGKSAAERKKKLDEVLELISRFRKT